MITVRGWAIKESDSGKAILFVWCLDFVARWLPKSQVSVTQGEWEDTVTLPEWLAKTHGLRPTPTPIRAHLGE